jgi:F420-dependent oxidoreductase-like protein
LRAIRNKVAWPFLGHSRILVRVIEWASTLVGMTVHRLPDPSLVVLVGPSGSGKSTWAGANFRPGQVLSSDHFRALTGAGPHDQTVSTDAFALLEQLLELRMGRRLTTVIDTLGLDSDARRGWLERARAAGFHTVVVGFDTAAAVCRARNTARDRPVPTSVLDGQLRRWKVAKDELAHEGFDQVVFDPGTVRLVPATFGDADNAQARQLANPVQLRFDLIISSFDFAQDEDLRPALAAVARAAEAAGFGRIWLMDHFRQIPQVGPEWAPMLEPYSALAYLAGVTERVGLGTLVSAVGVRNIGLLAKQLATLDVLSGGRAVCGLGAGWHEKEQRAFGYDFPGARERLDLLEDALQALPLLWGPGSPAFEGKAVTIPEALAYPRPLNGTIPILVGGGGERRTLRLVAAYADACNLMGDVATIRHKLEVLDAHCRAVERDRSEIEVTVLAPTVHAPSAEELSKRLVTMTSGGRTPEQQAADLGAGTTDDQIGRFRELAEAGVDTAVIALGDLSGPGDVDAFRPVISAFA